MEWDIFGLSEGDDGGAPGPIAGPHTDLSNEILLSWCRWQCVGRGGEGRHDEPE